MIGDRLTLCGVRYVVVRESEGRDLKTGKKLFTALQVEVDHDHEPVDRDRKSTGFPGEVRRAAARGGGGAGIRDEGAHGGRHVAGDSAVVAARARAYSEKRNR